MQNRQTDEQKDRVRIEEIPEHLRIKLAAATLRLVRAVEREKGRNT